MKIAFRGLSIVSAVLFLAISTQSADRKSDQPVFKVGVDTVFLRVAVTDPLDRSVTGLEKENFKVYEDKVQQNIVQFTQESAPVSVGIVFDVSGSMGSNGNIQAARAALKRFLEAVEPEDEFFLVAFNQAVQAETGFTKDPGKILSEISMRQPSGQTALYDAVYKGLDLIRQAKNEKKALILISDGEDNSSRYSVNEVREFARESDAQIYAIGERGELGYGVSEIDNIVGMTGGRAFFPDTFNDLDYYIDLIHSELKNQYVLGYVPAHLEHDGKWRKIQVKLEAPPGLPRLVVRSKQGYYAAKN